VWAFSTGSVTACNRQPSESDVGHDHIRLGQHQVGAVTCIVIGTGARHVEDTGTTQLGETVGGSSCGGELSSGWGSAEMISNGGSYANGKVLIKGVGKHLLPTAQSWRLWRPGPAVAAPDTGHRHINLFCYLVPRQALITQFHDLLCGGGMSGSATTHGDSGAAQLIAKGGLREA